MESTSLNPSVLERQRARLQWQQQHGYNDIESFLSLHSDDQCMGGHGWPISPSTTTTATTTVSKENKGCTTTTKKRKAADKSPMEEKGDEQRGQREPSGERSSKEKESKKLDYIHVRARRGQATDSHSLAERVRRERISERMKYLQGLVPGCNKITGKAGMLDEIINYVQSLQKQVEFLSMKLATVNPGPDFNMEALFNKEMNLAGLDSSMTDPSYLQSSLLQQVANCCGYDMAGMHPSELALLRTMSTPVSSSSPPPPPPEAFLDPSFHVHRPSSTLENELHSLYGAEFHQGRGPAYPFHSLQGNLLPNNLKMEM